MNAASKPTLPEAATPLPRPVPPDHRQAPAPATSRDGIAAPGRAAHHTARGTASSEPETSAPARTSPGASALTTCPGPPHPAPARQARAFLDLGAVLTAPGCARAWTREILWEWDSAELANDAELIASELVTNSVSACTGMNGAVIRLVLTLDQGELAVLVRDDHPAAPVTAQPDVDDETGRGLLIVEALSDRCGWYPLQRAKPAKVTWAVISKPGCVTGELPGRLRPDGLRDAGTAGAAGTAPALPARPRRPPAQTTGMRAPRHVDPVILARVKAALKRL